MQKELATLIPLLIVAVIVFRRSGKARKVQLVRMWISPTIFALVMIGTLLSEPFPGWLIATAYLAAAAAGIEVGLLRAHHADLSIDPKTRKVFIQSNAIGSALTMSFLAVRFGAKMLFPQLRGHSHAGNNVNHVTDGLTILTVAMLFAQNIFVRSRVRLLLAAQAAKPIAGPDPSATEPPAVPMPEQPGVPISEQSAGP